jgi:hypothetical protein
MPLVVRGGISFARELLRRLADAGILVGAPSVTWNKNGRLENALTQAVRLSTGRTGETTCQVQTSDLEGAARGLVECQATLDQLIATIVSTLAEA